MTTTSQRRKLVDAHAALVAAANRIRYGDVRSAGPVIVSSGHEVRCAVCGQRVGSGERVQHVEQGRFTELWAHPPGACPDLYDVIDWTLAREYDYVLRVVHSCRGQRCRRCGGWCENVPLYGVARLPELWVDWTCERCVRL